VNRNAEQSLLVDSIACEGVGMCALMAPHLIRLDPWGFPLLPKAPLNDSHERQARKAVSACPKRALYLSAPSTVD
jgi:ferredoxin